jgi:hypothetical protein
MSTRIGVWIQTISSSVLLALAVLAAGACSVTYSDTSLNNLSVGMPKDDVLRYFAFTTSKGDQAHGMRIRAARRTAGGKLLEVGEVPLWNSNVARDIPYWFLFEEGRLVQWGRPEDWRSVAARYQIDFNPSLGIPR